MSLHHLQLLVLLGHLLLLGLYRLALCLLTRNRSSPSGTTPQSANAASCLRKILLNRTVPGQIDPFRGAMGVAGYNIRCRKPMPPLKGRGGPRSGGEVRPRRQRLPIPQPTHTQQNPQGRIPGGLAFYGESSRIRFGEDYLNEDCLFISAKNKENIDEFREFHYDDKLKIVKK